MFLYTVLLVVREMTDRTRINFTFPSSTLNFEDVRTPMDAKQLLVELSQAGDHNEASVRYRLHHQKGRYCYFRCCWSGCKACFNYQRSSDHPGWTLTKARLQHSHVLSKSRKLKFQAAISYLQNLPLLPPTALKHAICPQFCLTDKQFYYVLAKSRGGPISPSQLISNLEAEGYDVHASTEDRSKWDPPELMMATNRTMKDHFLRYGETVSFDFSFNMVRNLHPTGKKWKVGAILCSSSCKRIVPLTVVISLHEDSPTYVQIFRTFFLAMGACPKVIVTDEDRAIGAALRELQESGQFRGTHLLDSFHVLKNVRKHLDNKEDIKFFSRLIHSPNRLEFEQRLREAQQNLPKGQISALNRFVERGHRFCFALIEPNFVGFTPSSSPNQSFHSLIKRVQPSQKDFSSAMRNILGCTSKLLSQCHQFDRDTTPYERIFQIPELAGLRLVLSKPILGPLIGQLAKGLQLEQEDRREDLVVLREHRLFFEVAAVGGRWTCTCAYYEKTLIPCRHMLKVIICRGESILAYIDERWLTTHTEDKPNEPKGQGLPRGREKASKRKMLSN